MMNWCKDTLEQDLSKQIQPYDLLIELKDETGQPVARWRATNTYPVKWSVAGFDAMKNEVAIESIELSYNRIERDL